MAKFSASILFMSTLILIPAVSSEQQLNLKEANVVDVEKKAERFSVTLIHDDEGEDGFANWWQIETPEGEIVGRRTLLHSHGTREFKRSEKVKIPKELEKVIIRAHDQKHGYGGQAAIYWAENRSVNYFRQGVESKNFTSAKNQDVYVGNKSVRKKPNTLNVASEKGLGKKESGKKGFLESIIASLKSVLIGK